MDHQVAHDLEPKLARTVAHRALESYAERFSKYAPEINWTNDDQASIAFTVAGKRIEGALNVEPKSYRMSLDVPLLMRPFSGRAFKLIDTEVAAWLERVKLGEL
jgi:Putative polyhydroxyalkanoic acid system protein (PHA_gran_rgn)